MTKICLAINSLLLILLLQPNTTSAQTISGPTIVDGGKTYLYVATIPGGSGNFNWSVGNGTYVTACENGNDAALRRGFQTMSQVEDCDSVYVTWQDNATTGFVSVDDGGGNIATLSVTIYPALHAGTVSPLTQSITCNTTGTSITIGNATGGNGTYLYQCQYSTDNVTWVSDDFQSQIYNIPTGITQKTYVRWLIQSYDVIVISAVSVININNTSIAVGSINTGNQSISYHTGPQTMSAPVTGGNCMAGPYQYQWQSSLNGSTYTDITGAVGRTYNPGIMDNSLYFRLKVTINGAQAATSPGILVTVIQPFSAGAASISAPAVTSGGSVTLTATAASGNTCGSYTYNWQSSTDERTWSNISTTATGVTVSNITVPTYYRRKATCGTDNIYTNEVAVKIKTAAGSNIPNTATYAPPGTQTVITMPGYGTANPAIMNYVYSYTYTKPGLQDSATALALTSPYDVQQVNAYFDGLGRGIQTVAKQATPAQNDLISTVFYDPLQREAISFLPYSDNLTTGAFRTDAATQQAAFYNQYFNNNERYYYGTRVFENSVLSRVLKQTAPGKSWTGQNNGPRSNERTNTVYDTVKIWTVGIGEDSLPRTTGTYPAGALWVTTATDENFNQMVEYKDMSGRVVLKKVQASDDIASGHYGWACTYYVYDDQQNLRVVIQPLATDYLRTHSWAITAAIANELFFQYNYDQRRRMTIKRVPGSGEVYMVYDARDRLVMTQDSMLRAASEWLFTDYDALNRPVKTGNWLTTGDRVYHQGLADNSITYPTPAGGDTTLTETYYDDYSWVPYADLGLPTSPFTGYNSNNNYFYTPSDLVYPYPQALTSSSLTLGMITGTKVKAIRTASDMCTVNFYDDKMRLVQAQGRNYSGAIDTVITQYSFSGQVLRTLVCHGKGGANPGGIKVVSRITYDAGGRVTQMSQKTGNSPEVIIAKNSYDELGQLAQKKIGQRRTSLTDTTYTVNPLDSINYTYNVRGWLRGINKDYANNKSNPLGGKWFGMEMSYDFGFTQSQTNGNITGIKWRSSGDGAQRAYGFWYDDLNRLTEADFTQYTSSAWNKAAGIDYSVRSINYDLNGNIKAMNQMGVKLNTSLLIDSLVYNYTANTNRLKYVFDNVNDTSAHLGDFTEITSNQNQDYYYDGNGNLTQDKNKKISNIHYNFLNLPDSIFMTGKGYIRYIYTATGIKLQKIVSDNATSPAKVTKTLYLGAFIYQNDTLQYAGTPEGRVRPKVPNQTDTMFYDYMEKDHLGNTRVVLTDEKQQDVYPAATLENNANAFVTEQGFYTINTIDTISVSQIASWSSTIGRNYKNNNGNPPYNNNPYTNTTAISTVVYKLNGDVGDKTGLGVTLKVMNGDVVDIYGRSFWHSNGTDPDNNHLISNALTDFITSFAGTSAVASSGKGATATALGNSTATTTGLNSWLGGVPNPLNTAIPKAYINWILFDEQFNVISSNSGFDLVKGADSVKLHHKTVNIGTCGYLYVYCSNESDVNVFFDNLQVIHTRGPLLETDNYYPFGLTQVGISNKAAGKLENKRLFNGYEQQYKEFSDGSGLEWYDYKHRFYDNQLGRFFCADKLSDKYPFYSPYQFAGNEVTRAIDQDGLEPAYTHTDAKTGRTTYYPAGDNLKRVVPTEHLNSIKQQYYTPGDNSGPAISGALSAFPIIGEIKGAIEGLTGKDLITGEHLSVAQRALAMLPAGTRLAKGTGKLARALNAGSKMEKSVEETTTIYRAVSKEELADIQANGFRSPGGATGYETGKLFATSAEDASQFGKNNFALDGRPNYIVSAEVPNSVLNEAVTFEADGMKAISIPSNQLPLVKSLGPLNFSPKPTNPYGMLGW